MTLKCKGTASAVTDPPSGGRRPCRVDLFEKKLPPSFRPSNTKQARTEKGFYTKQTTIRTVVSFAGGPGALTLCLIQISKQVQT